MNECKDCRWFVDEQKTFTVEQCALLGKFTGEARKVCAGELFQAHPPLVPATTNIFGEPLDRDGRVWPSPSYRTQVAPARESVRPARQTGPGSSLPGIMRTCVIEEEE